MLKKILITILFTLSFSDAISLNKRYFSISSDQHGIFDTWIKFSGNEYDDSVKNKDWIAIYKKGASTDWENVIDWRWVKNLDCIAPATCHDVFLAKGLDEGEYEVRYFKNNSYTIDTSIDMSIKPHSSYLRKINFYHYKKKLEVYFTGFTRKVTPNPKDWVALYRVDSDNVIKWSWVKDLRTYPRLKKWIIDKSQLEGGDYEIRYFLNNSFTRYKKSKSFHIAGINDTILTLGDIIQVGLNDAKLSIYFKNRIDNRTDRDWIALFQSDKDYVSKNIIAWKYLDQDRESGTVTFNVHPRRWKGVTLEAVLFKDDSYTIITVGKKAF